MGRASVITTFSALFFFTLLSVLVFTVAGFCRSGHDAGEILRMIESGGRCILREALPRGMAEENQSLMSRPTQVSSLRG
jgi:hypothetical protein